MYTVYVKTGLTLISLSLFFVFFFLIIIILRLKVCKSVFSEFKVVLYSPSENLGLFPKQLEDAGIYFWKPLPAEKTQPFKAFSVFTCGLSSDRITVSQKKYTDLFFLASIITTNSST